MVETIIGDRKKSGYGHGASPLFIKLPAELRLEIYREAFSGSQATIEGASLEQDSREDQTQESLRIRPGTNFEGDPEPRQIPHRRAAGQDARQLCGKGVVAFFGHFKRPRTFRLDDAFDVIYSVFDCRGDKSACYQDLINFAKFAAGLPGCGIAIETEPLRVAVLQKITYLEVSTEKVMDIFINHTTGKLFETKIGCVKDEEGFQEVL